MKVNSKLTVILIGVLCGLGVFAATMGDQHPFGKYGAVQVSGYDGGTGAPLCLGLSNQNAIMVRNFITDGGAGATLYCGFDTSVTVINGMPVMQQETLTVDMVTLTQNALSTPPTTIASDGGIITTVGTLAPKLCCIGAAGSNPTDLHWMIVK